MMHAGPEVADEPKRQELVALYAALAAHTEPECASRCPRPPSCCEPGYCAIAVAFARDLWGVEPRPPWNATLPRGGPAGCIGAPHLRPVCAAHTCEGGEPGRKRGDDAGTRRYD